MAETPGSDSVSTRLQRIAELAREAPQAALTTLAHHIDIEFLRIAYARTRRDGAVGVDGQTADAYAEDLEANLQSLLDRLKSGDAANEQLLFTRSHHEKDNRRQHQHGDDQQIDLAHIEPGSVADCIDHRL